MRVAAVGTGVRVGAEAGECTVGHATVAGSWTSVVHGGWRRHAVRAVLLVVPRVNGADIYVERVTKVGMGSARPC
jgi:hypothetical protein